MISADCTKKTVLPESNFAIEESQLPVKDGTDITYSCPKKHSKKGSNIRAVCDDGLIRFTDGSPDCSKIGMCSLNRFNPG